MKIAIDTTPLLTEHKYRGIGKYTNNFIQSLEEYDKNNVYSKIVLSQQSDLNFDLLLIPYFSPFNLSLPFIKKVKTLVTVHDLIPKKFPDKFPVGIRGELIWNIQKRLLLGVEGIITDSDTSKKDIIEICNIDKNKVFVVYPSVNKIFQRLQYQSDLKVIKDRYKLPQKFVLYVGDCNWNKNVPILVKASQKLNIDLVLVGKVFQDKTDLNHPWNSSLKEVFNLTNADNRIKKLGYVNDEDLVSIYNLAQLYIQPSYYEGFGLSMVEAFACGCPVIASDKGSLKEVGGEAPLYFNPQNLDELTKKIKDTYSNEKVLTQLREKGLEKAKKYSGLNFVLGLSKVYEQVTKE